MCVCVCVLNVCVCVGFFLMCVYVIGYKNYKSIGCNHLFKPYDWLCYLVE